MAYEIEMIADFKCRVGEGPVWDPKRQVLDWTDIQTGRMFEFDPATGESRKIYQGDLISSFQQVAPTYISDMLRLLTRA